MRKQIFTIIGTNISTGLQFTLPNIEERRILIRNGLVEAMMEGIPFEYCDRNYDYSFIIPTEVVKQCTWTIHRQTSWQGEYPPTVGVK